MTRGPIRDSWFNARRALAVAVTVLLLAVLVWFAASRLAPKEGQNTEVATAGQYPTSTDDPHPPLAQAEENSATDEPAGREPDPARTQTSSSPPDNLDLEEIVREFILILWGGETPRAESDYVPGTFAKLESDDPATRRRGEFELQISAELRASIANDPYYPQLHKIMTDAWSSCLKEYGLPSLENLGRLSKDEQDALLKERSLIGERLREFEDNCWGQSRIYAGKDEETALLLEHQQQYYFALAQQWVKANPDKLVPLQD